MKKNYTVSIGPLKIEVKRNKKYEAHYQHLLFDTGVHFIRTATARIGRAAGEYLRTSVKSWSEWRDRKSTAFYDALPKHSLFCEKRCCNKSFNTYHRYLKNELVWGKDGHLL